jgi:2-oxoglutarate ferredoxin oxidoreductase subunit alpha
VGQGDINQARWGTHGDHNIIAMTASNHQDVFAITVDAFNLAETYRTPVVLLFDEIIGHMRERLVIPEPGELDLVERLRTSVPKDVDYHPYLPREDGRLPMSDFGDEHRYNVTGLYHDMWGFPSSNPKIVSGLLRHLIDKIDNRVHEITRYKEHYLEGAEYILVSYGASARSAIHLAKSRRNKGEKIGVIELQTIWPFPTDMIREKCRGAKAVLVVEMNMGQVMQQVRAAVEEPERVFLANRFDGKLITPTDIKQIMRVIQGRGI